MNAAARSAWRIVRAALVAYLLVALAMLFLEKRLIFFPHKYPGGDWRPIGLKFEDAWFTSADGTKLHGWYVPHERPRAVVLFAIGNAGNLTYWTDELRTLHDLGLATLAFDYRGYGRSEGSPDETGILADARAARTWLAKRAGLDERELVLMGRSLGGSVAVDLAAGDGARGLILQSTFASLPDAAAVHYPWLPVRWLMKTRLDSLSKIGNYRGPLFVSHGDIDEIVPYEQGQRLYEAAPGPKQFFTIPGGLHNDSQPLSYYRALDEWLDGLETSAVR